MSPTDPQHRRLHRNVPLYYAYTLFTNMAFWLSVDVVYFQHRGLSYTEIMWLLFAQSLCQVSLEVPSGVLSDRYGRKIALFLGLLFKIGFCILCLLNAGFSVYLVAACLLGTHMAFESGTDSAFVYDTLDSLGRAEEYTRVRSRGYAFRLVGNGLGAMGGGYLAVVSDYLPWIATALACVAALVVTSCLVEPTGHALQSRATVRRILSSGFGSVRNNRRLLYLILFSAVMISSLLVGFRYQQPYLELADIKLQSFGPVYLAWLATSTLSALYIGRRGVSMDERRFLFSVAILLTVEYVLLGVYIGSLGVAVFLIGQVVVGVCTPMLTTYMNREVTGEARATVLSLEGFVQSILLMLIAPAVGAISDRYTISEAFLAQAVGVMVAGFALAHAISRAQSLSTSERPIHGS